MAKRLTRKQVEAELEYDLWLNARSEASAEIKTEAEASIRRWWSPKNRRHREETDREGELSNHQSTADAEIEWREEYERIRPIAESLSDKLSAHLLQFAAPCPFCAGYHRLQLGPDHIPQMMCSLEREHDPIAGREQEDVGHLPLNVGELLVLFNAVTEDRFALWALTSTLFDRKREEREAARVDAMNGRRGAEVRAESGELQEKMASARNDFLRDNLRRLREGKQPLSARAWADQNCKRLKRSPSTVRTWIADNPE